jgi:peptidylprolyl isomerase
MTNTSCSAATADLRFSATSAVHAAKLLTEGTRKIRPAGYAICGAALAAPAGAEPVRPRERSFQMSFAEHGSTVTVSYVGTLENGRIFDSTDEHGPLALTIGSGQVFPALEREIIGMRVNEVKNIVLQAEDAFGPRLKENMMEVARHVFPAEKEVVAGQKLSISFAGGVSRVMTVLAANDSSVMLDGNHPLAGCELTFALRLDSIESI